MDMIFVARQLQETWREHCKDLYSAFNDLSKSFDTVNCELPWKVLGDSTKVQEHLVAAP